MFTCKNFKLTDEEYNTIKEWANNHKCPCKCGDRRSLSCSGGEISVTFTPTAIGIVISANCICGEKIIIDNR